MAPGSEEERKGVPFVGPSGELLRMALRASGLNPDLDVNYANLARCRPENDDFDTKDWADAEKRCWRHLTSDLAPINLPLLLLGTRPVQKFMADKKAKVSIHRGLWIAAHDGRDAFVVRHPSAILRTRNPNDRAFLKEQFMSDIARMASRVMKTELPDDVSVKIYPTLASARDFLTRLSQRCGPWAFDIETYDAGEFPSRKAVATDCCHPDFRVRGIAIAWSATHGAWLELKGPHEVDHEPSVIRAALDPAFGSDAEKWAFMGDFDENGLVYPGLVSRVNRRSGDGMLAMVALGDARHESLRLEKAVIDILKKRQSWNGTDKNKIEQTPIEELARGSVGDAVRTFELCQELHARLERGEYTETGGISGGNGMIRRGM